MNSHVAMATWHEGVIPQTRSVMETNMAEQQLKIDLLGFEQFWNLTDSSLKHKIQANGT